MKEEGHVFRVEGTGPRVGTYINENMMPCGLWV